MYAIPRLNKKGLVGKKLLEASDEEEEEEEKDFLRYPNVHKKQELSDARNLVKSFTSVSGKGRNSKDGKVSSNKESISKGGQDMRKSYPRDRDVLENGRRERRRQDEESWRGGSEKENWRGHREVRRGDEERWRGRDHERGRGADQERWRRDWEGGRGRDHEGGRGADRERWRRDWEGGREGDREVRRGADREWWRGNQDEGRMEKDGWKGGDWKRTRDEDRDSWRGGSQNHDSHTKGVKKEVRNDTAVLARERATVGGGTGGGERGDATPSIQDKETPRCVDGNSETTHGERTPCPASTHTQTQADPHAGAEKQRKGSGQSANSQSRARQTKDRNKSSRANHSRKALADKKKRGGML